MNAKRVIATLIKAPRELGDNIPNMAMTETNQTVSLNLNQRHLADKN